MALMLFALGLAHFGWLSGSAVIHGLKVAAAVIAQAVGHGPHALSGPDPGRHAARPR